MKKRKKGNHKYFEGQKIHGIILKKLIPKIGWEAFCTACDSMFITRSNHLYRRKSCGCLSKNNRFKPKDQRTVVGNIKYSLVKTQAKKRDIEWKLNLEEYINLIEGSCYYCGDPGSNKFKYRRKIHYSNGLDRQNNKIGYITNNVVSCCKTCNFAKSTKSVEDFKKWVNQLLQNKDNW